MRFHRALFDADFFDSRNFIDEMTVSMVAPTFPNALRILKKYGSPELVERMAAFKDKGLWKICVLFLHHFSLTFWEVAPFYLI
jgi:hypothetical protein